MSIPAILAAVLIAAAPNPLLHCQTMETTAYCACVDCCGQWSGGYTATGVMPIDGVTVAVDPDVIPLGAEIIIDGHRYIAQDTGNFPPDVVDIYMDSHDAASEYGRQIKTAFWEKPNGG